MKKFIRWLDLPHFGRIAFWFIASWIIATALDTEIFEVIAMTALVLVTRTPRPPAALIDKEARG